MEIDGVFIKGSSHEICEDHIMIKENEIILSDGCSSAPYTDIGSRVITNTNNIEEAQQVINLLNLKENSLTATRLSLIIKDNLVTANIKGDGFLLYKINDEIIFEKYDFTENAPYYPVYELDLDRKEKWLKEFNQKLIIEKNKEKIEIDLDINFKGIKKDIIGSEWVLIGSDGLFSFNTELDNIIKELSDFKIKNGRFLKRRINKMIKKLKKENIDHYDDLSVGGVWF